MNLNNKDDYVIEIDTGKNLYRSFCKGWEITEKLESEMNYIKKMCEPNFIKRSVKRINIEKVSHALKRRS